VGAKIRRWWWGVNNWKVPDAKSQMKDTKLAKNVSEVSVAFLKVRRLGILTSFRLTDRHHSTIKQNFRVRRRIERAYGSIAFTGVNSEEPLSVSSHTNQISLARPYEQYRHSLEA
jgi:hypothetical protein